MKKFLFTISLAGLLIAGIIIACTSLKDETESKISPELRAQIEQVGILHNQGLDSILIDLLKEKNRLIEEDRNQPLADNYSLAGFPVNYDFNALVHNTTKRVVKNWCPTVNDASLEAVLSNQKLLRDSKLSTRSSFGDNEPNLEEQLTPFQWDYNNRMLEIFEIEDITLCQLTEAILALEVQIEMEAPTIEDAELLLYVTSIARNSAEYWHVNIENWVRALLPGAGELIDGNEEPLVPLVLKASWKDFFKADAVGAIMGGAIGGVAGGIGAGPGALGGGVGGSGAYAVGALIDWVFSLF